MLLLLEQDKEMGSSELTSLKLSSILEDPQSPMETRCIPAATINVTNPRRKGTFKGGERYSIFLWKIPLLT